jgi:signal transduction histidine kinase
VPVIIRDLIGQTRRTRQVCRVAPSDGQPFRGGAGLIAETGGVWAAWEEASGEIRDREERERCGRKQLLREMALTLSHELGNALVSLATMRQLPGDYPPLMLMRTAKDDVAKLETLNRQLSLMQTLNERETKTVDLRDLVRAIGESLSIKVEVGPEPVGLAVAPDLVEFALRSLIDSVAENWPAHVPRVLTLELRATGDGANRTALLSLRGHHLELEGVLPEPGDDAIPHHGRLGVFLAKEIIQLHQGEIHAGPGVEGTEILISLRSLPPRSAATAGENAGQAFS